MDESQLLALKPELDRFLDRFAPLFGRGENQAHARRFVQGLLQGGERRNAENIAQTMSGGPVRSLQAFITTGAWPDAPILAEMRRLVLETLADDDAVWNSDETGFPKKGAKSVGVKRQYSGTLGRTDNCQVAVFANYCSAEGHTFMDRRLFLPEEWAADRDRRAEAGVPPVWSSAPSRRWPWRWWPARSPRGCRSAGSAATASTATARRSCRACASSASGTSWTARPMPASGPSSPGWSRPSRGRDRHGAGPRRSPWSSARRGAWTRWWRPCRPGPG